MGLVRWRDAWDESLYGDRGFFLREAPASHFGTAANGSSAFAGAIWTLVQRHGLNRVVDVAAGRGELLCALDELSGGSLDLVAVELAERPSGLPVSIGWRHDLPDHVDGLLIACEWLDNIACDVVEVDPAGVTRYVLVDPMTGEEQLGDPCTDGWLDRWWRLREPGARAEIGAPRDAAWADAVARVDGLAVAIDYGHLAGSRPAYGSLRSYRDGREVDVRPDGQRDVAAHVAIDAVAAAAASTYARQSETLRGLGLTGRRPPLSLATDDPGAYVAALSRASACAELLDPRGWGDFWWLAAGDLGPMEH